MPQIRKLKITSGGTGADAVIMNAETGELITCCTGVEINIMAGGFIRARLDIIAPEIDLDITARRALISSLWI